MEKPTRKTLQDKYDQGPDAMISYVESLFDSFAEEIALLKKRIEELEDQKARDSVNSSKPPSSDGPKKRTLSSRSLRKPQKKNRVGGQKGHKGSTLEHVSNPDHKETLAAPSHCSCGHSLQNVETALLSL